MKSKRIDWGDLSSLTEKKAKKVKEKSVPVKKIWKRALKNFVLFGVCTALAVLGVFATGKLLAGDSAIATPSLKLVGVFEIWHIESFEGGKGTRASVLTRAGTLLNRQHKQVFFIVRSMTGDQLRQYLSEGRLPDLVSFSYGEGQSVFSQLVEMDGDFPVREDFASGGRVEGKTLALPYMTGGYALIASNDRLKKTGKTDERLSDIMQDCGYRYTSGKKEHTVYSLAYGFAEFNNPTKFLKGNKNELSTPSGDLTQAAAYEMFYGGRATMLLGTQRDLCRVENLVSQNTMPDFSVEYFDSTDLIQYIGVCKPSAAVSQYLHTLYSDAMQSAFTSVGMLAVTENGTAYKEGDLLSGLEKALKAKQSPPSVFAEGEKLKAMRQR